MIKGFSQRLRCQNMSTLGRIRTASEFGQKRSFLARSYRSNTRLVLARVYLKSFCKTGFTDKASKFSGFDSSFDKTVL